MIESGSCCEHGQHEIDRLKLQLAELQKYYLAVESAFDGIVITDPKGAIVYANHAFERISGYSRLDLTGKPADLWECAHEQPDPKRSWEAQQSHPEFIAYESTNKTASGSTYIADVRRSPILSNTNELVFFVIIIRDITQEKEIDRAKTEFVSLASHQLRTPLTAINWYTTMLIQDEVGALVEAQIKYLQKIDFSAKRMTELVNSLLNVSRVELGKVVIEPAPTNLIEVANGVLDELVHPMELKSQTLIKEFSTPVTTAPLDPKLVRIIFQNLLTNAVKYTPEKGTITLVVQEEGGMFTISVRDTGYGIPQEQQNKIFTKLFRADNIKEHDTDGNGLGLYLVKMILDKAGGDISFTSQENVGTTFVVHIPTRGWQPNGGTKSLE